MIGDELDNEIQRAQRGVAQGANPLETLEWANHLRELLAMKRGTLRSKGYTPDLFTRMTKHGEIRLFFDRTNAEQNPDCIGEVKEYISLDSL